MPFGLHKHSNRSKQALNDQSLQGSSAATPSSSGGSPVFATGTTESFRDDSPPRSSSKRYSNTYPFAGDNSSSDEFDARNLQDQSRRYSAQVIPVEHKKHKSLFDRMRSGGSRHHQEQKTAPPADYNNTKGLSRRLSKRLDHPSPTIRTVQRNSLEQTQHWQSGQGSRSHLPSPHEAPEEDVDLYQFRDEEHQQSPVRPRFSADDYDQPQYPSQQHQTQTQYQGGPESLQNRNHLSPHLQRDNPNSASLDPYHHIHRQNSETVSQFSNESPTEYKEERRPPSAQSNNGILPAETQSSQRPDIPARTASVQPQTSKSVAHIDTMAPPSTSQQNRRTDMKQSPSNAQGQPDPRDMPPGYRQSYAGNSSSSTPSMQLGTSAGGSNPPNYSRGGSGSSHPYANQQGGENRGASEQGRSTPPPAPSERDIQDAYKELSQKYKKVKGLYFDKTSQVEQLQNTLANQRLSQSRTSLDDNEYMTRFQRLDGAITNLAFNIRKDWKAIPSWIAPCVNQDASRIGRQEMTAVGRACISRFLVDEIFSRCFHPGLDVDTSSTLKAIEQNIRRFHPTMNSQEESDALTSKVLQWRLATLDGLRDALNSPEAEECKKAFAQRSTTNLTAHLINCLIEPTPPGVEDSAHMIVELAVSIAANLPLESRDISIIYPMPGDVLASFIMKVETGLPALDNPGLLQDNSSDHDGSSIGSTDDLGKDNGEKNDKGGRKEKPKGPGMLSAMMGQGNGGANKKGGLPSPGIEPESGKGDKRDNGPQTVRFAGFVGVEVRGRQVLVKSPVWTAT